MRDTRAVPQFRIPGPLRRLSEGQITVTVEGTDLGAAIDALDTRYPGFKDRLLDQSVWPGARRQIKIRLMARRRLKLIFGPDMVKEPVIYQLGKQFELVTNIRRADVSKDQGWVLLEVTGEPDELDRGVEYLESRGVKVEPAEGDLVG